MDVIVLNVGLGSNIIDTKMFTILVLKSLLTTLMTSPILSCIYPTRLYRPQRGLDELAESEKPQPVTATKGIVSASSPPTVVAPSRMTGRSRGRSLYHPAVTLDEIQLGLPLPEEHPRQIYFTIIMCLSSMRSIPSCMHLMRLFQHSHPTDLRVQAMRLISLTDRTSMTMLASSPNETLKHDAVSLVFGSLGRMLGVSVRHSLALSTPDDYAFQITNLAEKVNADVIVLPMFSGGGDRIEGESAIEAIQDASMILELSHQTPCTLAVILNPLATASSVGGGDDDGGTSDVNQPHDTVMAITSTFLLPLFDNPSDLEALQLVCILAKNPHVHVKVLRFALSGVALMEGGVEFDVTGGADGGISSQISLRHGTLSDEELPAATMHAGDHMEDASSLLDRLLEQASAENENFLVETVRKPWISQW